MNYHIKKFGFIHSFYRLISQYDFIVRNQPFFMREHNHLSLVYIRVSLFESNHEATLDKFSIEDLNCILNRVIMNIYCCVIINRVIMNIYCSVISKEHKRQDSTRINYVIDVDQKQK